MNQEMGHYAPFLNCFLTTATTVTKQFSACSVSLGGGKIDLAVAKSYFLTSKDENLSALRSFYQMLEAAGGENIPVSVPKRSELNAASDHEMGSWNVMNTLKNSLGMNKSKNWCETFNP